MKRTVGSARWVWVGLVAVTLAGRAAGDVIYQDPLTNTASGNLDGTSPADRGGVGTNGWTANPLFKEDGSVTGVDTGSAWLPFTPATGNIYYLSATIDVTSGGGNWITLGFAKTNDTSVPFTYHGYGSVLLKGDRGANMGATCMGLGAEGGVAFDAPLGEVKFTIVLDAQAPSSADWTVRFFANDVPVRGPVAFDVEAPIHYVGFSKYLTAAGTIRDFQLVVAVAGPSEKYADDFSGEASDPLNGTVPDIRSSGYETWIAAASFHADGSVGDSSTGSAWLPFTPAAGNVYQLSATIDVTSGGENWITLGFAATADTSKSFTSYGYGSVGLCHNRGSGKGATYMGPGQEGPAAFDAPFGEVRFTIVLDAQDPSSTNWTVSFFANDVLLRGPVAFGVVAPIHYVGFSKYLTATGTIRDLQLVVVGPSETYADDFSGGASDPLNGTVPDIRTGGYETWIAAASFHADGSVGDSSTGSAWLPFTPATGNVYHLSATIDVTSGGDHWITLGFAETADTSKSFTSYGYGSVFLRNDRGTGQAGTWTGPGASGFAAF
ncbi:MAG: hypothetical protein PHR35_22685, partial [Kiritimatiellae bacterium]|nr:hypothetical protein [Kiritimatiellia bacterium]